jgi:hypothetical protein
MTVEEFNNSVEKFEINMPEMTPENRLGVLIKLTRCRREITGSAHGMPELLIILERSTESYARLSLYSEVCSHLYIYDN